MAVTVCLQASCWLVTACDKVHTWISYRWHTPAHGASDTHGQGHTANALHYSLSSMDPPCSLPLCSPAASSSRAPVSRLSTACCLSTSAQLDFVFHFRQSHLAVNPEALLPYTMSFAPPNRRLYVGRISQDATRADLVRSSLREVKQARQDKTDLPYLGLLVLQEDLFGSFGPKPTDVKLLSGFGFVEYDSVAVSWREAGKQLHCLEAY